MLQWRITLVTLSAELAVARAEYIRRSVSGVASKKSTSFCLAALTICIGEMGEMIDTEDQLDFVSYVAGVISGILHVRGKDLH